MTQRVEISIAIIIKVHLHAVYDFVQALGSEIKRAPNIGQRFGDRMTGLVSVGCVKNGGDFLPPPRELCSRYRRIGAFIHYVVHFTAKGVKRGNGATFFQRKLEKAVIKARSALSSFFLAILIG